MRTEIITAQEIVDSYKKSGIKPINNETMKCDKNGKFCGCALTSLYVAYHGVLPDITDVLNKSVFDWSEREFGDNHCAIVLGFDTPGYFNVHAKEDFWKQRNEATTAAQMLGLS